VELYIHATNALSGCGDKHVDNFPFTSQMFLLGLLLVSNDSVVILFCIIHTLPRVEYIRLSMSHQKGKRDGYT
jgi:hypothetical protein